jgi:hypothetical protein
MSHPTTLATHPTVRFFRAEKRSTATHLRGSTAAPESAVGQHDRAFEPRQAFMAYTLTQNRHGPLVDLQVTGATGLAEREGVP